MTDDVCTDLPVPCSEWCVPDGVKTWGTCVSAATDAELAAQQTEGTNNSMLTVITVQLLLIQSIVNMMRFMLVSKCLHYAAPSSLTDLCSPVSSTTAHFCLLSVQLPNLCFTQSYNKIMVAALTHSSYVDTFPFSTSQRTVRVSVMSS